MSKLFKNRKLILISLFSSLLLIVAAISIIALINSNKDTKAPRFVYNSGHYITDQSAITTSTLESEYTKMNTLYTNEGADITKTNISFDTNKTIAIETALDFYAFGVIANSDDDFLGYKYELLSNIDMNDAYEMFPIGYNGKTFSGTFNGNGHTIKNLKLQTVISEIKSQFNNTHYYALFCRNSGTVANFGLLDPKISINVEPASDETSNGIFFVSNVVGLNTGTVSYIFVRDNLESEAKTKPGIEVIELGYHISGLVAKNGANGTFNNSYYASSTVISSNSARPAELQEVLLENEGNTPTNIFFYNSLIQDVTKDNGAIKAVKYGGFIDKTFNYTNHYGEYEESLNELNIAVLSTNSQQGQLNTWYMGDYYNDTTTYGELSTFFDSVITPITRGFRQNQVSYTDGKYYVEIANANDFSYIYELMDTNSKFASNAFVYTLNPTEDSATHIKGINLDNVLSPKYKNGIAATFTTKDAVEGTSSTYATLYLNSFSYKVTTLGIDAYGVFPYLTGTVKCINFVVGGKATEPQTESSHLTFDKVSSNITAYGAIAGYAEGATIDHCNVYNNFEITNKVGKYFVGGAVGILAGESTISNTTASGKLISKNTSPKSPITNPTGYPSGVIMGGVVGYIDSSLGTINKLLNTSTITAEGYTSQEFVVGGVVGAGYTDNATQLQNNGSITISNSYYSKLYVSGVIGRLLGVANQITLFTNNGDITVTQINAPTYVSGVLNADIQTTATISESLFKQKSQFYFYAAALTNGANVTVSGTKADTYMYTNVINVMNNNGFITKLSGIYNLNYRFSDASTALGAQSINTNLFNKFAPVLVSNSTDPANTINLATSYNLRDITLTQSETIDNVLTYTGCTLGKYITYADVRNEGNITFEPAYQITGDITISGVFNELSSNSTASSIYNGGDIEINYKANIEGNINVAGICYSNRNGITNIDSYNPTSTNHDSTLLGSLNDAINNGNVKVSSEDFDDIDYAYYWYRTSNNRAVAANIVYTTYTGVKITGNINTAGIVNINESVITNTFNLGNVKALNYITETTIENRRQINAGGISTLNVGQYAYIINSANNGDITAANLASYTYTARDTGNYPSNYPYGKAEDSFDGTKDGMISGTTTYYSDVTVGGIVSRNDKLESGENYSYNSQNPNPNSKQVISFTINYGSIYAYNFAEINYIANSNPSCKAAAIVGSGLCNVINVNNYGAVYSGDVSAGIFGLVSLANYSTDISLNKVYIANTLNYGNIYSLKHGYDAFDYAIPSGLKTVPDHTDLSKDLEHPTYDDFKNDNLDNFKFITDNSNTQFSYFSGSVIGIIDFNNDANATQIVVRYLVSFNENLSISGAEMNVNNFVTANTTTIYSPYLKPDVVGKKDRDDYLATNVQYAPLSSESFTGEFLKTNSTSGDDYYATMTFYGVFNEKFTFRQVIEGKNTDSTYYDTTTYKTDRFLTDFFQFVPYTYVNDNLMEKIGWKTGAYLDAANKFANSLEGTYLFYKSDLGTSTYNDDLTAALSTKTWSEYANPEILIQLIDKLNSSSDKAGILAYIEYIFSESNDNSSILNTLRGTIVNYVYKNYGSLIDTSELLSFANGYSTILANALCSNSSNEVKQDIITYISDYIYNLNGVTKEELLLSYIDYLDNYGSSFFSSKEASTQSKYELLQKLFSEITDGTFYEKLISLFNSTNQNTINGVTDYSLSGYGAFINKTPAEKVIFFTNVIASNTAENIKEYLDDFATEIGFFDYLRTDENKYDVQSFSDINNRITDTTNLNLIDERVKLWNKIRNTTTFQNWFNTKITEKKYYLATEYNNTYQTNSAPIPYGVTGQNAINMVRSNTPNVLGESSDLDFIYTTNVTPNTYFYGPYASPTTGYLEVSSVTVTTNTYYSLNGGSRQRSTNIPVGAICYTNRNGNTQTNPTLSGTYFTYSNGTYTNVTKYYPNYTYYVLIDKNTYIPNGDGTTLSNVEQGNVATNSTVIASDWTINNRTGWYSVLFTEGIQNLTSVTTGSTNGLTRADNPLVIRKRTTGGCYDNSTADGITAQVSIEYRTIKTGDYILINNSIRQNLDYILISRTTYNVDNYTIGTQAVNCASGDKYTVYHDGEAIPDATNLSNWNYLLNNYVYTATVNTANSNWYDSEDDTVDGRTGLYVKFIQRTQQRQIDYDESCMFTTRYIDYSATQLLQLDGKLTKYTENPSYESTDEKNIINDLFNTVLLTNETEFMQIVAKALFETLGSTNTDIHIDFINNFVGKGVTTSNKVNDTTAPLVYLLHTKTPSQQTISAYLATLSDDNEFKKKLLNAASKDKDVFVELIELLFNKSLVVGADESYVPGQSLNYGGNFDTDLLNSRLEYIAYNKYSATPSNSLPNVVPGKNLTDITYTGSETKNEYTVLATGEKIPLTVDPNSITSNNYSGTNASEAVSSQNIGYYLGNQNKINQKTITFVDTLIAPTDGNSDYTYANGDTPSDAKTTPKQLFVMKGPNGNYQGNTIRALTNEEFFALPEGIQNLVPTENTSVTHSMIRLSQRYPGNVNFQNTTQNDVWSYHGAISYYGKTYGSTGNGIALPNNGIWFKPKNTGTIRFVFYTGSDGQSFSLVKVNRNSATVDNPFAGTDFSANKVNLTGCSNLPSYLLIYYEYEVTAEDLTNNVEFWLLGGDGSGAYFLYLDMGINGGTGPTTEDITYYEQHRLNQTTNYDANVYELISYLTPLNAGNNVISYIPATNVTSENVTNYYTYTVATTYNSSTTYYSKDDDGHYVIAHGVTAENVTNYYLFSQATTYDSTKTYYVQHTISEYQTQVFCERFMKILASSSNEATYKLIKSLDDETAYKEMLKYLVSLDSRNFDSIITYANAHSLLTNDYKYYLTGGWLATDYYRKYKTDFSVTYLHDRLTETYQYLEHKTYLDSTGETNDITRFIALCEHIGYDIDNYMQYGIFALASNEGIQNGVFIPDNLNLDRMDPEYTTDTNVGFKLIETNDDLDTSLTDAKWRGGTGTEEGEDDISGYTGNNVTVNQAFYIEMKQLNKSISTVVFELTLEKDNTLYYGDIDLDKGTITYYVESLSTGTYNVENLDLAYGAKAYDGKITEATGTRFNNDSTISVTAVNVTSHQFTVFAEDTRVYKTYSIIFKELTTTLTMEYNTTKTTGTTDATHLTVSTGTADKQVVLNITSNNDKLPKGFDLKPYLSLTDGTNTYSMDSEYVKISTISTDHKIKDNGTAEATLTISYKLPAGTYQIRLSICGQTKAVEYKKEASDACDITKIKFNGTELTVAAAMTSNIKFGRAYNNIELTDIPGTYSDYYNFYLDNLEVSENATVTASVDKVLTSKSYKSDADTTVTYNITSYVVTYTVTAENGTDFKTYTHTLTEYDPYDKTNNHKYGDIYKDGVADLSNTEFDETVDDGTRNQTYVSFERGNEAYYRLKYDFSRIYTLSNNIVYSMEETTTSDLAGVATFNLEYKGISADVNEFCDAGTYSFLYKYRNTQEWGLKAHETDGVFDGTFTKTQNDSYIEYTFPRLVIEKTYSTDATLHSIVLMDAYTAAATASTVMSINNLRPTDEHLVTAEHEEYYQNLITTAPIYVGDEINYQYTGSTDFSGAAYTDYYSVGTVSNAQLSNYAPTFSIESHAMMFQSTTLAKIKNYGSDKQGNATDASILGDHISTDGSVLFLFLPFTYEETENNKTVTKATVFLGKLEDKEITDIYPVDYDGTGSSIATLNMTLNEIRAMKLDSTITCPSFTNGGISYTLSDAVGNATNNPSLNMDYIGTPVDDHFWYVSYVVFSEDYIRNTSSYTHIKFYHIALIDHDNNVYFTIKVVTPKDATFTSINDIYITVLGYKTNEEDNTKFDEIVVGAYVKKAVVDNTNNTITYELKYSIQILPSAYYYFYIDLPGGYVATSEITDSSKANTNQRQDGEDYADAYLPPASIVVQRVPVTITVTTGTEEDSSWAIATSDIYTRKATLKDDNES